MATQTDAGDSWFTIQPIDDSTFAISEEGHWEHPHSYLFLGDARALLIDSGLGIGSIRPVVRSLTDLPVSVATTHAHWDHTGGHREFDERLVHALDADWLRQGIPVSVDRIREMLMSSPPTKRLPPDFSPEQWEPFRGEPNGLLQDGDTIDLGRRHLAVLHTPGHSPGHVCFHDTRRGHLVTGDLLYRGTLYAYYESTDPVAFARSIDRLAGLDDVVTILPGHHELGLDREFLLFAQAAFSAVERKGELRHGTGTHHFGAALALRF